MFPGRSFLFAAAFPAAERAGADLLFLGETAEQGAAAAPYLAEGPL